MNFVLTHIPNFSPNQNRTLKNHEGTKKWLGEAEKEEKPNSPGAWFQNLPKEQVLPVTPSTGGINLPEILKQIRQQGPANETGKENVPNQQAELPAHRSLKDWLENLPGILTPPLINPANGGDKLPKEQTRPVPPITPGGGELSPQQTLPAGVENLPGILAPSSGTPATAGTENLPEILKSAGFESKHIKLLEKLHRHATTEQQQKSRDEIWKQLTEDLWKLGLGATPVKN